MILCIGITPYTKIKSHQQDLLQKLFSFHKEMISARGDVMGEGAGVTAPKGSKRGKN